MTGYLTRGDLSHLIRREEIHGSVAESLMKSVFRRGVPEQVLDEALPEGSLERQLEKRVLGSLSPAEGCRALRLGRKEPWRTLRGSRSGKPGGICWPRCRRIFPRGGSGST